MMELMLVKEDEVVQTLMLRPTSMRVDTGGETLPLADVMAICPMFDSVAFSESDLERLKHDWANGEAQYHNTDTGEEEMERRIEKITDHLEKHTFLDDIDWEII